MLECSAAILGGRLDSIGRWVLTSFDYRVLGVILGFTIVVFCFWRRIRYKMWPSREDCLQLALSLAGTIGGISAMVVFLFTKPPAIEMLSGTVFVLLGLVVPIVIFGNAFPRMAALFFPPEAPNPPKMPRPVQTRSLN